MSIRFRPLRAEEVECRVNQCSEKGCSLLLYKDARCDMRILDETLGPDKWECSYDSIDGKLFCTVGVCFDRGDGLCEWVRKQDTGTPSNMEAQKGEASDAFKRACFKWGIGRELYTAPRIWVGPENCTIKQGRNGKPQCYDDFRVTELVVEDGQIVKLTIANMSRRGVVVYGNGKGKAVAKPKADPVQDAKRELWAALQAYAAKCGGTPEDALEGVKKRPEWESQQHSAEWLMAVAAEYRELADG